MKPTFASWELFAVWGGAMALAGLALHFTQLLLAARVQVRVSAATRLPFQLAAWISWAANAFAGVLLLIQPLLNSPTPFRPWLLWAVFGPLAIPLGQMSRVVRGADDQAAPL